MKLENLEPDELFIVEWQYNMLGDFRKALVKAIMKADIYNLARLSMGFPDEVQGYKKYSEIEGWWEALQKKAETGP